MKKSFLMIFIVALIFSTNSFAQDSTKEATSPIRTTKISIDTPSPSEWGKSIGEAVSAVKEAFIGAVHDSGKEINEFQGTKVGQLATWMIAWKVVGKDVLSIIHSAYIKIVGSISMCILLRVWWKTLGIKATELLTKNHSTSDAEDMYIFLTIVCGIIIGIALFICLFK